MKVCYVGENGSVHNQKWIKALSAREDIELHVISFDRGVKFDNVKYHFLKKYSGTKADYLLNLKLLNSYLAKIKPDLLHAHYATSYGFMSAYSGFHPLIITGWGADIFDSPKNPVMRAMLKYSLSKADGLSVLSEITLKEIKKFTLKEVELIPFGVDTDKFVPRLKKESKEIILGTIRTLSEKYGVEYLIRAFARLSENYDHLRLEIIGDGELKADLIDLTVKLGIENKVVFHGYVNQQTDFEKYYAILSSFDIFVIPSILDSETFGVAAVEAEACGISVIGTYVGGLPEVIREGVNGLIVKPKSEIDLALAIEKLVNDEEMRKRMGKEGRKIAEQSYNWKLSIEKMIHLYKKVLRKI